MKNVYTHFCDIYYKMVYHVRPNSKKKMNALSEYLNTIFELEFYKMAVSVELNILRFIIEMKICNNCAFRLFRSKVI